MPQLDPEIRKYVAEAVGTMILMLIGPGTAIFAIDADRRGRHRLAFGFALLFLAYTIGNISGCHINPAVTLAFLLAKKIDTPNRRLLHGRPGRRRDRRWPHALHRNRGRRPRQDRGVRVERLGRHARLAVRTRIGHPRRDPVHRDLGVRRARHDQRGIPGRLRRARRRASRSPASTSPRSRSTTRRSTRPARSEPRSSPAATTSPSCGRSSCSRSSAGPSGGRLTRSSTAPVQATPARPWTPPPHPPSTRPPANASVPSRRRP